MSVPTRFMIDTKDTVAHFNLMTLFDIQDPHVSLVWNMKILARGCGTTTNNASILKIDFSAITRVLILDIQSTELICTFYRWRLNTTCSSEKYTMFRLVSRSIFKTVRIWCMPPTIYRIID